MSEEVNQTKSSTQSNQVDANVAKQREQNAHPGFFLRSATWLLARFPLTRNSYQNWTVGRRILVGWVLWLICLPIIPIVAALVWYIHDPEGFKNSPYAKGLIVLVVVWAGAFGLVATNKPQLDANGKYSPVQTTANGEVAGVQNDINTPTPEAKQQIQNQSVSNPSNGRKFDNCTEAFKAGVFNIKRSDAAYQKSLDRDNDGIACEK